MSVNNLLFLEPILPDFGQDQTKKVMDTINLFCQDLLPGMGIDFNVFDWTREEQIGIFIGIFQKTNLITGMPGIQQLFRFAVNIAKGYFDNPYHSFNHAVDVAYVCYYMTEELGIGEQLEMTSLDKAVLYISALAHDVLHPGTNNLFQVNSKSPVATKYDNKSVLETQSADFVKVLLNDLQLIENLNASAEELKKSRIIDRICELILKTDMIYHFGQLDQLLELVDFHVQSVSYAPSSQASAASLAVSNSMSSVIGPPPPALVGSNPSLSNNISPTSSLNAPVTGNAQVSSSNLGVNAPPSVSPHTPKNAVELFKSLFGSPVSPMNANASSSSSSLYSLSLAPITKISLKTSNSKEQLIQIILHAADISNPVRPFHICKKWSDLVLEEFICQGKMELAAGLPISPNMDPATINQTQTQLSFTRLIVQPLFESLFDLFPRTGTLIDLIVDNLRQWGGIDFPAAGKHRRGTEEKYRGKKHSTHNSAPKRASEGGRRLSLAAGTVEIPEALQKLLTKSRKPSRNSLRNASHLDGDIPLEGLGIEEEEEIDGSAENSPSIGDMKFADSAPNLSSNQGELQIK